jgi:hypothetical protein
MTECWIIQGKELENHLKKLEERERKNPERVCFS